MRRRRWRRKGPRTRPAGPEGPEGTSAIDVRPGAGVNTHSPGVGGVRAPGRPFLAWFGLAVLLGPGIGLAIAILSPQPRAFLWSSTACFVLVPLVVLVNGLPPPFFVSPTFVGGDLLAHYLAGAGLTLLVVGIVRD